MALCSLVCLNFSFNSSKIDPQLLLRLERENTVDFLIILKEQAQLQNSRLLTSKKEKGTYVYQELKKTAHQSQQNIIQLLTTKNVNYRSFWISNSIYAKGDHDLIEELAKFPEIKSIQNNPQIYLDAPVEDNYFSNRSGTIEWGLENIHADDVWNLGYRGQGVVIAGQDTGYDWIHPALQASYRGWDGSSADHNYNWHDAIHEISPLHIIVDSTIVVSNNPCGLDLVEPCDDHNHGTHTMGSMVGDDGEGNQIGVAPAAKWIACRNMERGWGSPFSYMECFEWFLAPTDLNNENPNPAKAPHVINNSWACPDLEGCDSLHVALMRTLVQNVKSAGIVVVASAGNSGGSGCGSIDVPAAIYEESFTVGAIRSNDTISGFSSRGPVFVDGSERLKPNVCAPGSNIRSSIRNGEYANFSGTSMAGPHVAGVVALLISANPDLEGQVEVIEDIIESTCRPKYSNENCGNIDSLTIPNNTYGYGNIDALAAVNKALSLVNTSETVESTSNLVLYPNPSSGTFYFQVNSSNKAAHLTIFDTTGKEISQEMMTSFLAVDLSDYPDGLYYYNIQIGEQFLQGKLIKH